MANAGRTRIDVVYVKSRIRFGFKKRNEKTVLEIRRERLSENKKVVFTEVLYTIGWYL